jgi:hypothetical protein
MIKIRNSRTLKPYLGSVCFPLFVIQANFCQINLFPHFITFNSNFLAKRLAGWTEGALPGFQSSVLVESGTRSVTHPGVILTQFQFLLLNMLDAMDSWHPQTLQPLLTSDLTF